MKKPTLQSVLAWIIRSVRNLPKGSYFTVPEVCEDWEGIKGEVHPGVIGMKVGVAVRDQIINAINTGKVDVLGRTIYCVR